MILDFLSDVLHVPVIYSAQIHTMIICIAMESFTTAPNGLDRLLSHLMWEMLPPRCFEGSKLFGSTKRRFDLPPSLDCDWHRLDKVNYSILRPNTRVRRAWIEGSLVSEEHSVAHTTSMLETGCSSSHWHIVRMPANSTKRCWVMQANT